MFDDSGNHLRRMEEALLEDESFLEEVKQLLDDDEEEEAPVRYAAVRNNDRLDVDLENYSEDVYEQPPKEKGIRGLMILACLESLAIAAVILYWLVYLL